ncbi:MAG: hypothetical protein JKY15_08370, partial [Deltaproteobacteria bacterium]|nr:hypothetical protein [Deltaproteobacteria bacterium]
LGDIPLIGHLFKTTEKKKEKRNLLLILTPYVVRNDDDLRRIYERKNREREMFSKLYFGDKITKFDPYVDYEKKRGPLSNLINQVGYEMQKTENGGPGLPGEIVIRQRVHEDQAKHEVRTLESYVEPEVSPEGVVQERYVEPKHLIPTEVITVEELPPPAPAPAPIEEFTPEVVPVEDGAKAEGK